MRAMDTLRLSGHKVRIVSMNTAVVGAGAAGLCALGRFYAYGQRDIALICEDIKAGTSRNTGSDKQTYYKLTLSGSKPDSVRSMTKTLFDGLCVDGDIALAEAALSASSFFWLAEMGVPFPKNRYGEYTGYKTDHDPMQRATSAGPLTSKMMTEALEADIKQKGIKVYNGYQVIRIITECGSIRGLLCLDLNIEDRAEYVLFNCKNVIYATGGPAAIYQDSVYPLNHYGSSGIAFEVGVKGKNLTEWQYGLASVAPRWNVSGSYMQVLPRIFSADQKGRHQRDFLKEYFKNDAVYLNRVFLKGYQWPFDVSRIENGSSVIDLLVYEETRKGRRVFIDYTQNPLDTMDYSLLENEAFEYLEKADMLFGTPIERLIRLNEPAYALYRDKGVDLKTQPLEIALCAQHHNGGLSTDCWWQTNVEGFFAVGEVSATHGVYRPGGSALNAGQVGAERAALYISVRRKGSPGANDAFIKAAANSAMELIECADSAWGSTDNVVELFSDAAKRMSLAGAAVRCKKQIEQAIDRVKKLMDGFSKSVQVASVASLSRFFYLRDALLSQYVVLNAMADYIDRGGGSRGSAVYPDEMGEKTVALSDRTFSFSSADLKFGHMVQETLLKNGQCTFFWRPVRPIPGEDDLFENVWRRYREDKNIY